MGQRGFGQVKVAEDVGLERALQLLVGDLGNIVPVVLLSGVIDHDVDLAEVIQGALNNLAAKCRGGHIAFQYQATAAFCFY